MKKIYAKATTLEEIKTRVQAIVQSYDQRSNHRPTWKKLRIALKEYMNWVQKKNKSLGCPLAFFDISCDIGQTMTAQDVLEGYLIVVINLQMSKEEDFTTLVIKQEMLNFDNFLKSQKHPTRYQEDPKPKISKEERKANAIALEIFKKLEEV